jgi:hypothetical protein
MKEAGDSGSRQKNAKLFENQNIESVPGISMDLPGLKKPND